MNHDQDRDRLSAPHSPGAGQPGTCTCETPPGGVLLYRLRGDHLGSIDFDKPLDGFRAVLVDFTDAGFFGSTALDALLGLRLDAQENGLPVHISAPPPLAARVLQLTGADTLFPRHASLDEALSALT
ncbi:STAS domain-containing protein [Streptacidiphilus rugosus]|uniref:STAS domain-containing protein n=1 Tax=Streptacidiphilus rugosus TaxID=405783 RepID=UPI0006907A62|nr:STAS domain-containing protein [Streptacidiphilus rugosus]